MQKKILYKINLTDYIKINLSKSKENKSIIYFNNKNHQFILFDEKEENILDALEMLRYLLQEALDKRLKLPKSINNDIGYLWNNYIWNNDYSEVDCDKPWIGKNYLLWHSNKNKNATWLYEKDNKIILEVTPVFICNIDLPIKDISPKLIEFMKNYEPLVITEITQKIAREWFKQTEELIDQINKKRIIF